MAKEWMIPNIKIIRSKRKTISLQITDNVTLIVRAPLGVNNEVLERIIAKHRKWIERKQYEVKTRKSVEHEFTDGENFLYLGNHHMLKIVDEQELPLIFDDGFFISKRYLSMARELFVNWYKIQSYKIIGQRVEYYGQKFGFKYNRIKITGAQKRWGSCSSNGNLNFSWRLIMAPMAVIDYVVIHELVHLEERNHGKHFWMKVEMLMPDHETQEDWLKKYGYSLTL